jgi:hypothetical protein
MQAMLRTNRFRITTHTLAIAVVLGALISGLNALATKVTAQSPLTSVIVELKSDPVVVAKAKAEAAGSSFNADAYRQQVIAEQQSFLQRLALAGVPYTISSVTAPNGPVTPTIQFRFNYVYNGIGLQVPNATISTIAALPEVFAVHPDQPIVMHLDRAVDYTRAPLELTACQAQQMMFRFTA